MGFMFGNPVGCGRENTELPEFGSGDKREQMHWFFHSLSCAILWVGFSTNIKIILVIFGLPVRYLKCLKYVTEGWREFL